MGDTFGPGYSIPIAKKTIKTNYMVISIIFVAFINATNKALNFVQAILPNLIISFIYDLLKKSGIKKCIVSNLAYIVLFGFLYFLFVP